MNFAEQAHALQREVLANIPLARAMALCASSCDDESLTLSAPLAPNVNDKGCVFGGSLASVMTLASWGLLKHAADARKVSCDLYVQDSSIRYLAPVWEDFSAIARLADGETLSAFFDALADTGKARTRLRCVVPLSDGKVAASLEARFVALAKG